MSSGKATIRSTAKIARKNEQDRRVIKKWILGYPRPRGSDVTYNIERLRKYIMFGGNVRCFENGIFQRIDKYMSRSGLYSYNMQFSINGNEDNNVIIENPNINFLVFLDNLGIRYSRYVTMLGISIDFSQPIEPKPVKYKVPKPMTQAISPINLCQEIILPEVIQEHEVIRLMKSVKHWKKRREELISELDGVDREIILSQNKLRNLMKEFI